MKQCNVLRVETGIRGLRNRDWRKRAWLAFIVVCGVVMSGVVVLAVQAYSRGGRTHDAVAGLPKAGVLAEHLPKMSVAPPSLESERVEVELITVTPDGVQPRAITRPPGRFYIALENRSGLRDVNLRLDRQGGERLIDAPMPNGKLSLKYLTDYPPGVYLVTETSHADWVCRVTIREK